MRLDLVVANGTVVDGTGAPAFRADVGVRGGRIAVVSRAGALEAARAIDARGLVVAPGFVDLDSHVDWAVIGADPSPALARWLRQGVTTAIGGACGYSPAPVLEGGADALAALSAFLRDGPLVARWRTFGEFLDAVESARLPLNVGFTVGQNTVRAQAAAAGASPAGAAVIREAEEALRAGALGISAWAGPPPFAGADDLAALARVAARAGALLAVHARAYTRASTAYRPSLAARGPHNLRAVRELLGVARETGVRLHVLHLAAAGRRTWRTASAVLGAIDAAAAEGLDVGFDASPYTDAVGPIRLLLPDALAARLARGERPRGRARLELAALLQRALVGIGPADLRLARAGGDPSLAGLEGRSFSDIARIRGTSAVRAQVEIAARAGVTGVPVVVGTMSGDREDDGALPGILAHPRCAVATNAASTREGLQNPSVTGAFPRVLGRWVRERRLLGLEEAVRRMTSLPAARLGLADVGRVAEGAWADLAVIDPARVRDPADPERADARPEGIRTVLVSGVPVCEDGRLVEGARPGRVLRRAG